MSEQYTYSPTAGKQVISLLAPPVGAVTIKVNGTTLATSGYSLSGGVVTITAALAANASIVLTYTAGLATETKNESYFYDPVAGVQTITLTAPITSQNQKVTVTIGSVKLNAGDFQIVNGDQLKITRTAGLTIGDTIFVTYTGAQVHGRGDTVWVQDPAKAGSFVQAHYQGGEAVTTLGSEPLRYIGGEQRYYSKSDHVQQASPVQRITMTGTGGAKSDFIYSGLGSVTVSTGGGADSVLVQTTHTASTTINTNGGNDTVAVQSISGDTTINLGTGSDQVGIGNWAGYWPTFQTPASDANGIVKQLTVNGGSDVSGADLDTVTVDDTKDNSNSSSSLNDTTLVGLFGTNGYLTYSGLEQLTVKLGNGDDAFDIVKTHGTETHIAKTRSRWATAPTRSSSRRSRATRRSPRAPATTSSRSAATRPRSTRRCTAPSTRSSTAR